MAPPEVTRLGKLAGDLPGDARALVRLLGQWAARGPEGRQAATEAQEAIDLMRVRLRAVEAQLVDERREHDELLQQRVDELREGLAEPDRGRNARASERRAADARAAQSR